MRLVTQHHKIFDTQTTIDYSVQRISPSYLIECILEIYRFAHPIRLVVSFLFSEEEYLTHLLKTHPVPNAFSMASLRCSF